MLSSWCQLSEVLVSQIPGNYLIISTFSTLADDRSLTPVTFFHEEVFFRITILQFVTWYHALVTLSIIIIIDTCLDDVG